MEDELFDKLQNMSEKFPERFNILEEQIDVKLQLQYFNFSKRVKKQANEKKEEFILEDLDDISNNKLSIEEKKIFLVKLASIDDPKAFRIIEDYTKNPDSELHHWSLLALQESKMLIESSLLDENQVFISTGLGGRGNMLRYFVVLVGDNIDEYQEFQQKMVKSEIDFALKNNNSELEIIEFEEKYALLTALIPFEVKLQQVFRSALEECNQYGGFLKTNFLVTNVKKLSINEIKDIVENNKMPNTEEFRELENNNNEIDEESDDEE